MAQVTYAAFLAWLLSFSSRLPQVLEEIQKGIAAFANAFLLINGTVPEGTLSLESRVEQYYAIKGAPASQQLIVPSDEEKGLEADCAALIAGPNAAFDGSRLRGIFKFLNDSGLLAILMSMLTKTS